MGKKNRKQLKQEVKGGGNKNNLVVAAILVVVIGYWGVTQLGGSDYPNLVSGVFFDAPVVSADTGKVTVPEEVVTNSKLVFVDVKLDNVTSEFNYLGRRIILELIQKRRVPATSHHLHAKWKHYQRGKSM